MKRDLRAIITLASGILPMLLADRASADEPGWEKMPDTPANMPAAPGSVPEPVQPASPAAPPLPPPQALPPPALPPGNSAAPSSGEIAIGTSTPGADSPAGAGPFAAEAGLAPKQIDLRATLNTGLLFHYIGVGASADVGVVRAGPGTIALGGGIEHDFCASTCWTFSGAVPMEFSQRQVWPNARASYHLGVTNAKNLDFYPVVALGPVFARSTVEVGGGLSRYTGTDTTLGVSMGAGLSWFIDKRWFVGGEAKIRYAAGTYDYALSSGSARTFDRGASENWSLNGIDGTIVVGARLP